MISIPEVDNNSDRLQYIMSEINEFIKIARKKNRKFRLRKFNDSSSPKKEERTMWKTALTKDSSSQFKEYVHGYYSFTAP